MTQRQEAPMGEQIVMSLGVEDMERAKRFYEHGLGFVVDQEHELFVSFTHGDGDTALGLYTGAPLKYDAALITDDGGYRGITLSCIVEIPERVDQLMAEAEIAGAEILEPAHTAAWGGYLGYFTDPDSNLWKVVVGQKG
jgi:catechol 2,3-dioxygenase-like lactoylglutathione lyase family enzyme